MHAHSDYADFLGYHISCSSKNPRDKLIHIFANMDMKIRALSSKGMCRGKGYPITMNKMLRENVQDIVKHDSIIYTLGFSTIIALDRVVGDDI